MATRRNKKQNVVQLRYFKWIVRLRGGVYQADGRGDPYRPGRHSLGTKDYDEAIQRLVSLDRVRAVALHLAPKSILDESASSTPLLLASGWDLLYEDCQRPDLTYDSAPSTLKKYRAAFPKFAAAMAGLGVETWQSVGKQELMHMIKCMEDDSYAGKTIKTDVRTIMQVQRWLITEGHLGGVSPIKLKFRHVQSIPAYCWTHAEVQAIFDLCASDPALSWLHDLLATLAGTGMRIGEAVQLKRSDVHLDSRTVHIVDDSGRVETPHESRRRTKNRKSRQVPISDQLCKILERRLGRWTGDYVFAGPRGGRLKADTARRNLIKKVIAPLEQKFPPRSGEAKSFRDGRLHSFRHYYCSSRVKAGVPDRIIQQVMGHGSTDMLELYCQLRVEDTRLHLEQLDLLGGVTGRSGDGPSTP